MASSPQSNDQKGFHHAGAIQPSSYGHAMGYDGRTATNNMMLGLSKDKPPPSRDGKFGKIIVSPQILGDINRTPIFQNQNMIQNGDQNIKTYQNSWWRCAHYPDISRYGIIALAPHLKQHKRSLIKTTGCLAGRLGDWVPNLCQILGK